MTRRVVVRQAGVTKEGRSLSGYSFAAEHDREALVAAADRINGGGSDALSKRPPMQGSDA